MAGTIRQIAQIAGVSRGTVDRALNHRGRINPEVARRIWEIAEELDYHPRKSGNGRESRGRTSYRSDYTDVGVLFHDSGASGYRGR